jgi:hypothetical protein
MMDSSGMEIDLQFNQIDVDINNNYQAALRLIAMEIFGLREDRGITGTDATVELKLQYEGVADTKIVSEKEGQLDIKIPGDEAEVDQYVFSQNALWKQLPDRAQQIMPDIDGIRIAMNIAHLIQSARFEGSEW